MSYLENTNHTTVSSFSNYAISESSRDIHTGVGILIGAIFRTDETSRTVLKVVGSTQSRSKTYPLKNKEDACDSNVELLEAKIIILLDQSYKGKLKESIQEFEKFEDELCQLLLAANGGKRHQTYLRLALLYYRSHMVEKSLTWLNRVLEQCAELSKIENNDFFRRFYSCLADILIKLKKHDLAKLALKEAQQMNPLSCNQEEEKYKGWNLTTLAQLHLQNKEYEQAEKLFFKSLDIKKNLKNSRLVGLGYDYLSDLYFNWGKLTEAKVCAYKAIEWTSQFDKDYYLIGRHKRNLGRIAAQENRISDALQLYEEAIHILSETLVDGNALSIKFQEEYQCLLCRISSDLNDQMVYSDCHEGFELKKSPSILKGGF